MKRICFSSIFFFSLLFLSSIVSAQRFQGIILSNKEAPVCYVNIGVVNKNIGTTSDATGIFKIDLESQYDNDTLLFSCIGYKPYRIKVADFKMQTDSSVILDEQIYTLTETVVKPRQFKQKTFGVTTRSKAAQTGFENNQLGYEMGIKIKNKKAAKIQKLSLNIARCSYDTIFYRINIYEVRGKDQFENILISPIYLTLPRSMFSETISFDITDRNVWVDGDYLVTIEHIRDAGTGYLYFCCALGPRTYFRKTSQGEWDSAPIGISLSVDALVER